MVDAARQMLDELMGRNRNLHPSEAVRKITWEDPDFCQYYIVKFCPHDLFVNTRADLGPCQRIHDDEAKKMFEQARSSTRKRQYEDDFLRFCISMLNDVDRKIQKGKQRLQLMNRDQPVQSLQSKYQEQVNNLNARIKKLLSEAEEAGTRGDVDQAQDLMTLCEKLKEEKEAVLAQYESHMAAKQKLSVTKPASAAPPSPIASLDENLIDTQAVDGTSPKSDTDNKLPDTDENGKKWSLENSNVSEKQMEVCETCGAFLIVGDAQQRIEDHLMGKQHLGYSKLRQAVDEMHEARKKEREDDERKRRDDRDRNNRSMEHDRDRRRDSKDNRVRSSEQRRRSRERERRGSSHHSSDKYRSQQKNNRSRHSRSRSRSNTSNSHHRSSRRHNSRSPNRY